jgi:hypothetical protein
MFMRYGYKAADGTVTQIHTPDDLIGKTVGDMTICGVYSTEMDLAEYARYDKDDFSWHNWNSDYYRSGLFYNVGMLGYSFVCKGFAEYPEPMPDTSFRPISAVVVKASGNINKDRALFKALTYRTDNDVVFEGYNPCFYSAKVSTPFYGLVLSASSFKDNMVFIAMIGVIVFSVFSALLMMNFLTVSLDLRKKEIGILRALGARRKDVTVICLIESLLIAAIDFVISLAAVGIISLALNKKYYIAMFAPGFLSVGGLFLLCFGVAALAAVIPTLRLARKKPVDIISNK